MKTIKKNNPVAVSALMGILGATLYLLMKQMSGDNAPATLTPVADTYADETPKTTAAIVSQSLQRDPFDHPALHRLAKSGTPDPSLTPEGQAAQKEAHRTLTGSKNFASPVNSQNSATWPILPNHTTKWAVLPAQTAPEGTVPNGTKPASSGADASGQEAESPVKGWRLTATIGGLHPRAVIEGAGIGIYRVGVGEHVQTLEVAAIYEREIVLSDAHHLYTLSLMAAPSAPEDSKDMNDVKDTSVQTITTTARENDNGTARIHP